MSDCWWMVIVLRRALYPWNYISTLLFQPIVTWRHHIEYREPKGGQIVYVASKAEWDIMPFCSFWLRALIIGSTISLCPARKFKLLANFKRSSIQYSPSLMALLKHKKMFILQKVTLLSNLVSRISCLLSLGRYRRIYIALLNPVARRNKKEPAFQSAFPLGSGGASWCTPVCYLQC
jgi:hypothetical protein